MWPVGCPTEHTRAVAEAEAAAAALAVAELAVSGAGHGAILGGGDDVRRIVAREGVMHGASAWPEDDIIVR